MNHQQVAVPHTHFAFARRQSTLTRGLHFLTDRYLLVPLGAALALIWANTAPVSYFSFTEHAAFYVNEIGMALFFALITQEILDAMLPGGALEAYHHRALPIIAAGGGILGSVGIFLTHINVSNDLNLSPAWPIVSAIDLAAAYYLLKAIVPRSPAIPFALLLGIATDVFGLIVVAPHYVNLQARVGGAALVVIALGIAALLRRLRVTAFWPYLVGCGALMWTAFYWEGLHPAFALIPIVPFLPHKRRSNDVFADAPNDSPVHHAEHEWFLVVQYIVFLFALVNAGVVLRDYETGSWGLVTASLVGRPFGILLAVALAQLVGLRLPQGMGWRELVVTAFASASGFTIGLFFATGMLAVGPLLAEAKIGVLVSGLGVFVALALARWLRVGRFAV